MTTSGAKKFQGPKGTRDFYPADLAVRRHIESVWRQVSINHGFDEIDGPTFEYLELYTHKSGPGIANELFQVLSGKDEAQSAAIREGAAAPYALRPEFTPTLARMVAAKAGELPRPIKWFAIPSHFRAERPQRGRLREFMQWNVDFLGDDSPRADAEVIATAIAALEALGLKSQDVTIHISNRELIADLIQRAGATAENVEPIMELLDRRSKIAADEFENQCRSFGFDDRRFTESIEHAAKSLNQRILTHEQGGQLPTVSESSNGASAAEMLIDALASMNRLTWCEVDFSIVRGLAYYTGTVFEIHEASGAERAIAGGGRYDKLIESFGGPSIPACGFGMGDVVLANILRDKGLLKPAEEYLPQPDAFVTAADDDAAKAMPTIVARLRRAGLHVRQSYKTTRNVGKLLGDAAKCRARYAVILGRELAEGAAMLKDMQSGEQKPVKLDDIGAALRTQQT